MLKNTEHFEVLQDPRANGKERPWRNKKIRSLIIAESFRRLGEEKKSNRVKFCGTYLEFTRYPDSERILTAANFCRERLCPMCQWRRSLRVFYEVSAVMDEVQLRHKELVPLFLTLTMRNQPANISSLTAILDSVFTGWHELFRYKKIKAEIKGWFRALELTYNKGRDEFHPHIHALIFVDKSYFKKPHYIATTEWVQLWRSAMRLDYDPICDIRRVRNGKQKRKGIAEVAKYTLKDTDFATSDNALTDRLVRLLTDSLKGRRLYAFGGLLKQIAAKFGKDEDLIKTGDTTIRQDVATVIERYSWRFGFANYVRRPDPPPAPGERLAQSALQSSEDT